LGTNQIKSQVKELHFKFNSPEGITHHNKSKTKKITADNPTLKQIIIKPDELLTQVSAHVFKEKDN